MLPISSNTADQGCTPVSSNCVVWQGPNLSCINLCKGDTVSDVVYKLATELCSLQSNLGLSDLDLSQLVQVCSTTPQPEKTLAAVLDLLIDKVVCLSDIVTSINAVTSYTEPTLTLPACLQYVNPQGQTITQLIHNQYTRTIAEKVCSIYSTVTAHTTQIAGINTRVSALENQTADALPQVSVECLTSSSALVDLDVAITTVSTELCSLKNVVGSNIAISAAASKQCASLNNMPSFSSVGAMSAITGWKTSVNTLSDSIFNLWLTVCDMRTAMAALKNCCGTLDCSSVIIDYLATTNSDRSSITLNFAGLCNIPVTLSECSQLGSKLTVTDAAGTAYITYVNVIANKNTSVTISLSGQNLNSALNYTVKLEPCVKNSEGKTCERVISKTLYAPCTNITINSATIS